MLNRTSLVQTEPKLAARFGAALRALEASKDGRTVLLDLLARYSESQRAYHTLAHIERCLVWLDWFAASACKPAEVELALWYHDAVYEPFGQDNVRASAELAQEQLRWLGVPESSVTRVVEHVLATEEHAAAQGDTGLVVDLDLSILGSDPDGFAAFECQVRREYGAVPDDVYQRERARVLQGFLSRSPLYNTPAVRELLEARARLNLECAAAALAVKGGAR